VSDKDEIRDLLIEIRDNQRLSLQKQEEHLAVAREQIDRARRQVQDSIELQRQAIDKVKKVSRIAIPGIILCVALIAYLVIRYF
jgi:cbb3-type cytochrome oxidase cytochrome c subunit